MIRRATFRASKRGISGVNRTARSIETKRVRRHHAMTWPAESSKIYDSNEFKKMFLARVNRNDVVQK